MSTKSKKIHLYKKVDGEFGIVAKKIKRQSKFGQRLQTARLAAGLDQRELSKASRVSFPLIYKLEGPGGGNPTLSTIQNLARALGVPVAALVGE